MRGLRCHRSLAHLLAKHDRKRHHTQPPRLTIEQILEWADAHCRRTGRFPSVDSGDVEGVEGENWSAIHVALGVAAGGCRPDGRWPACWRSKRGHRPGAQKRRLAIGQILAWADVHYGQPADFRMPVPAVSGHPKAATTGRIECVAPYGWSAAFSLPQVPQQ